VQSPDALVKDVDGNTVAAGDVISPTLFITPHPDGSDVRYARFWYTVSDGVGVSDSTQIFVQVVQVDDPPRPTLSPVLTYYEDAAFGENVFLMGGHDVEGSRYRVRFTVRPEIRGGLYYIEQNDTTLITPATTTLDNTDDVAFGWPMTFVPDPNDWDTTEYVNFSYVLEQIPDGLTGPENTVQIKIVPVNDAPATNITGIGSAQNHELNATVIADGGYIVPHIAVTDADIDGLAVGIDPSAEYKVTIVSTGNVAFGLDYFDYLDALVPFDGLDTDSTTFTMPFDVTSRGFRPDLTLDNLLSSLVIQAGAAGTGTITITIDDQANFGACSATGDPTDPPAPCAKTSVTTINFDVQAGTPPTETTTVTLTPVGG
jgi:hypothetical protein